MFNRGGHSSPFSKMDMHNSIIGSLENVRIHSLDNYLFIDGKLSVNAGGLIHVQNLISTFGGTLSVIAWRIESLEMDMAFMAITIDNLDFGLNMRITIDITPEMAAQQIEAWHGNDIMKCKRKCNLTLIDNSYLVPSSDSLNYEWQKKSMVN